MLKKGIIVLLALLVASLVLAGEFNVSAGKTYTLSPEPNPNYADPGNKLTDGSFNFSWGDMVGWENPGANPTVVVDLGETYEEVSYVALKVMYSAPSAVNLPEYFIVSISEDGELYEDLGMGITYVEAPVPNDTVATLYWATDEFVGYGRYVKIEIAPGGEAWTMIAEVIVGDGAIPEDMGIVVGGGVDLTDAATVSVGKPYMLIPLPSDAYPDTDSIEVTDGFARYSWADMIGFDNPAVNPTVIIDLLEPTKIVRVSSHFMRSFASAVNLPNSLLIGVSDDGMEFKTVGLAVQTNPYPPQNEFINEVYWVATEPVLTRYVKIEIRPRGSAWTMLAEATVWATE
ncbi:MAG: hypothetical protein JW697_02685 [Kosmotogaceae bacterium]|nr:hypothetical protein [Kosmotogaceae bacterium]